MMGKKERSFAPLINVSLEDLVPLDHLIFDNVENRSLAACRRALTPSGTLILNSGTGRTASPCWFASSSRWWLRRSCGKNCTAIFRS